MIRPAMIVHSLASILCASAAVAAEADSLIRVRADVKRAELSLHTTGLCIEDVNHEIYGGIYSQMIFGERFHEPAPTAIEGFSAYGGTWVPVGDELQAAAGDGPKLIAGGSPFANGEVSVQVRFSDAGTGLAGLIVKVSSPAIGADRFSGYEVSLDPSQKQLILGRHRGNWEPLHTVPCDVPINSWIALAVRSKGESLEILVNDKPILTFNDMEHPLREGLVGLRTWQRAAHFRNLTIQRGEQRENLKFRASDPDGAGGVSGMWRVARRGAVKGKLSLDASRPYLGGSQSQRVTFEQGTGSIGVENRGLNRWGLTIAAGKPYEGYLWMRADEPALVRVALESGEGSTTHGEAMIQVEGSDWKRYDFTLNPNTGDEGGRFAVTLEKPGAVLLGHAFLQPGPWGRFKGLPVRGDVAEKISEAGVTVMRLGGLMANADGYRWKNMIGPRDQRPGYKGFWYPHSSNGWGILDFLDFCEAAGILPVVDMNTGETPQDLADFVEYANGAVDSPWGQRRAKDGHPAPYGLRFIELGNEEAIDEAYWTRFKPLAESIWAKDPGIILIVGDFEYKRPIKDPYQFEGAPRIKSLAAHKKILDLAKAHHREVWFDVHIWNDKPYDALGPIEALKSFDATLAKLSPGASFRIAVLEENSSNHTMRRALAHGETLNGLAQMGDRVPIVCAANALQSDGQNDNGWDQGFVFLNPSMAWLQPPAYVTQMISRNHAPHVVESTVTGSNEDLNAVSMLSDDQSKLILRVVNTEEKARSSQIVIDGFKLSSPAKLQVVTGPIDATNTASDPKRIFPTQETWRSAPEQGAHRHVFPPRSFSILRFEK